MLAIAEWRIKAYTLFYMIYKVATATFISGISIILLKENHCYMQKVSFECYFAGIIANRVFFFFFFLK